jgi:hypothetical protein
VRDGFEKENANHELIETLIVIAIFPVPSLGTSGISAHIREEESHA